MGGGRGTRLHPLTQPRCKPAVPLAGKYRLVDIPISNCLNSGLNQIFVLTQFNTASLHRHIQESYKFDPFGGGFVDILSAEQTEAGDTWYQGTADAVRQNLKHFGAEKNDLFLILSGDQLYRMDFRDMIREHIETGADATIAATPVPKSQLHAFGLMRVNPDLSIGEFVEKPTDDALIDSLLIPKEIQSGLKWYRAPEPAGLASMGLYLFNGEVMQEALDSDHADFGKEVIPALLGKKKLKAYVFDGYWEDIGTVGAFFEANIRLTETVPPFNFFDADNRIFTRARYLPASKLNNCRFSQVVIADGCIIGDCSIERSVIGVRAVVRENCDLSEVVVMGSDYYEEPGDEGSAIPLGIGEGTRIRNAIVDKNARIGRNVVLDPAGKQTPFAKDGIFIRDGVLVVPKNAEVPDGYVF